MTAKKKTIKAKKSKEKVKSKEDRGKKKEKSRVLVTAALPYVNNVPHLGNLVPTISADVYARYLRLKGENIIFVCGTDEHGTTTEQRAIEEGLTPKEITDKYFKIHKKIYYWFNCSFDCFGRTSSKENKEMTIEIFNDLNKNGYIEENNIKQAYCKKCDKFLADRFVEGKCPFCGYEEARGDQCENCGKLLDPADLIEPRCKFCGAKPEIVESEHLFIDLPALKERLENWISKVKKNWSINAITMTEAWLKEGLKQRCITRDLKWGIPVPYPGFEKKVFYSWFDAPIGYISITKSCRKNWKEWWQKPQEVKLIQFMGKDNIPFHTILFPSFLLGTNKNWTLMDQLSANEYLNYKGGMFSKSRGIGVFGDDLIEIEKTDGLSADIWRYYLIINRPENKDTEFSWQDFSDKLNNELVGNLGNFIFRTTSFLNKYLEGKFEEISEENLGKKLIEQVRKKEKEYERLFEEIKLKEALKKIMEISALGNKYFQDNEPWRLIKEDKHKTKQILGNSLNLAYDIALLISPFLPTTAEKIFQQLNLKLDWKKLGTFSIKNHNINQEQMLFKKIEQKKLIEFEQRFGSQEKKKKPLLNLKVGKIEKAEDHPKADKLIILQVNLSNQGKDKRQIVAGLRDSYHSKELIGKNILVVSNLRKAKLRGKESQGMLLAYEDKEDKKWRIIEPQGDPGDKIYAGDNPCHNQKEIDFSEFQKQKLEVKDYQVLLNGESLKVEKGKKKVKEEIKVKTKKAEVA